MKNRLRHVKFYADQSVKVHCGGDDDRRNGVVSWLVIFITFHIVISIKTGFHQFPYQIQGSTLSVV